MSPALAALFACIGAVACAPSASVAPADAAESADRAALPEIEAVAPAARGAAATTDADAFDPFPGHREVAVGALFAAVEAQLPAIADAPAVRSEYDALRARHGLSDSPTLYADYVRVRTAFEATRAGGWWGLEWRVTDREPRSDAVWAQWRSGTAAGDALPTTTAIAECDELSALFAVVARRIGLSRRSQVGLLWPTSNHTVAVWVVDRVGPGGGQARIVVPTSQIFLDSTQSLDTAAFDPWRQKQVFDYTRRDVAADARLPAALARAFVRAVRTHGAQTRGALQGLRNRREYDQRQADAREGAR
jgi:hypothetical protein